MPRPCPAGGGVFQRSQSALQCVYAGAQYGVLVLQPGVQPLDRRERDTVDVHRVDMRIVFAKTE